VGKITFVSTLFHKKNNSMKTILTFLFAVAMVVFVNTANAGVPKSQPEQNVFMQVSNDDIVCNSNIDYHCATINQITFMEKKNVDPAVLEFYSHKMESPISRLARTLELNKSIADASKKFFENHKNNKVLTLDTHNSILNESKIDFGGISVQLTNNMAEIMKGIDITSEEFKKILKVNDPYSEWLNSKISDSPDIVS
jgi:hypothetical protein